ncbi:hypothetical protein IFM89_018578 [Coptis chinensis]|uniref:Deoxyhypusine hydroxylase n=1 Tax=Coptis chinensis TaxID=261450 RepID=A0A835ID78_9MAGN|nr:hypothetical protein IFM89_018578 [Coptis chinensis]
MHDTVTISVYQNKGKELPIPEEADIQGIEIKLPSALSGANDSVLIARWSGYWNYRHQDLSLHPIVRHEVTEALGAFGLEGARRALLQHEVAYVLGQLQNKAATAALSKVLKNVSEHPMVRHEAAEALGSIANSQSVELPEEFAKDVEPIVSQSCEVALRMLEFERFGKSFEYLFMQTPQVQ